MVDNIAVINLFIKRDKTLLLSSFKVLKNKQIMYKLYHIHTCPFSINGELYIVSDPKH